MEQKQDTKTFMNPPKLSYEGPYVIELTEDTLKEFVPDNVIIDGDKVIVAKGKIEQGAEGIHFYSDAKHFCLGYRIKNIRKDNGELIWVHKDHR